MPSPEAILAGLSQIANQWWGVALFWHGAAALALVGLLRGWRPSKRLGTILLALPLISVSVASFAGDNPFNGTVFAVAGLGIGTIGRVVVPDQPPRLGTHSMRVVGVAMIGFGWFYPHFLQSGDWTAYLYAAPLGLIPCPTLSMVVGFGLLADGFSSRAWSASVGLLALFYGLFGALRLGVTLDLVLLVGAVALLVTATAPSERAPSRAASRTNGSGEPLVA